MLSYRVRIPRPRPRGTCGPVHVHVRRDLRMGFAFGLDWMGLTGTGPWMRANGGGGGGQRPKKVCVPKIDLQFWGPLIHFIFFRRKISGVRGWVRRRSPGCHSAPAPSGNAKLWPG